MSDFREDLIEGTAGMTTCPNPDCVDGWWWCDIGDGEFIKQRCGNAAHRPASPVLSTKKCGACGGRGYWNKEQPRKGSVRELCPVCGGTGVVASSPEGTPE